MFTLRKSVKKYSVAQDDKICHHPKKPSKNFRLFPLRGFQCCQSDDTVQPLVLHTADRSSIVRPTHSDSSSAFNNDIKSFTYPTSDIAGEPFANRYINTDIFNFIYYL